MAKKTKMEILMKIKAQVDKSLPANMGKISKEMKNLKGDIKGLKDQEKLYSKQKALKKALQENRNQYKKQIEELKKLKKVKDGNKKLSKSEEKIYRKLNGDMKKLSKTMEKQKQKSLEYRKEINKLPNSYDEVTRKIKETEKAMGKLNAKQKIGKKIGAVKSKIGSGLKKGALMAGKAVAGAAIAGTIALGALGIGSVKSYVAFNGQMKRVQAISGATREEFNLLEKKAMSLGASTSFTSSEVAAGMEKMALAGFNTTQVLSGIPGVLDLAAAAGEDVALVSDIITDNLTAFNMTANDTGRFADVLAWGMSKTNVSVEMLGESFKYAAGSAGGLGVSLEEMVGSLGLMGDQAVKSGMAGRGLDAIFSKLAKNKDKLKTMGIKIENDDGSFVGIAKTVEQFEKVTKKMKDLDKVAFLENVFGKQGGRAFSKLLSAEKTIDGITYKGAAAVKATIEAAGEDSVGQSKKMKEIMLDGASGVATLLTSAYDGLKISLGKKLLGDRTLGIVKKLTSYISELANVINGTFTDSPINKFWQGIFSTTKKYVGKFKAAFAPIGESLNNIFDGVKIKKNLGNTVKLVIEAVLIIIDYIARIIKFLEPVIKFLVKHADTIAVFFGAFMAVSGVISLVGSLVGGIAGLIATVSAAGGVMATLGAAMTTLGGPVVWIIALFALLAYTIYKNWDDIVALTKMLSETLKEVFNSIGNYFDELHMKFMNWLESTWIGVVNVFNSLVIKVSNTFKSIRDLLIGFKDNILNFGTSIKDSFMIIPSAIKNSFTSVFDIIKSKMTEVKEMIKLPQPPEWVVSIASKIKSGLGVDGSHYNGLASVPHDGYIAELHRGERVLTATDNESYTNGLGAKLSSIKNSGSTTNSNVSSSSSNNNKFIFNPTITIKVDGGGNMEEQIKNAVNDAVAQATEFFMRQMEEMMDGKRESY